MKKALLFYLLLFNFSLSAQKLYKSCSHGCYLLPGVYFDGVVIIESADGNGSVSLSTRGISDSLYYLTKLDSTGALIWSKLIETDSSEIHINNPNDTVIIYKFLSPVSVVADSGKGYFVGSMQDSTVTTIDSLGLQTFFYSTSIVISNVDTSGNVVWSKKIETPIASYLSKMIISNNYLYLLSRGTLPSDSVFYLTKIDSTGNNMWTCEFIGLSNGIAFTDFVLNNNVFYLGGTVSTDVFLLKVDTSGNILWSNIFDSGFDDELVSVVATSNGCALGINRSSASQPPTLILADSSGNIINAKSFCGSSPFRLTHFIPYGEDKFLMMQYFDTILFNGITYKWDLWIIDSTNNFLLHENLGTQTIYFPNTYGTGFINVIKNSKGLLAMIQDWAYLNPAGVYSRLPEIVQMDSIASGCFFQPSISNDNFIANENISSAPIALSSQMVSITTSEVAILSSNSLITYNVTCTGNVGLNNSPINLIHTEVFPNPFSNELNVKTESNEPSEIILYDITSRRLLQKHFETTITLKTEQLTKGVYIYEIKHNSGISEKGKVVKE